MVSSRRSSRKDQEALGYNPNRTADLFALTNDGYIIAHDIACQHEFIEMQGCPHCRHPRLIPVAQINRSFQGLSEMVAFCKHCRQRSSFIFDISNDVYQEWLAERLGDLYIRSYDGPPRAAGTG